MSTTAAVGISQSKSYFYSVRNHVEQWSKIAAVWAASRLTEPVCKVHELFRRLYVVEALNPGITKIGVLVRKFFIGCALIGSAILALFTAPGGAALRYLVCHLQKEPFVYCRGLAAEKILQNQEFSHLCWNVCCIPGGYAITDGGVMPWEHRIDRIASRIQEQNVDVVCLYELFDTDAALCLYDQMKGNYAHFYFNVGPRPIGPASGIFVASKFAIKDPEFSAFPKEMLVGRAKNVEKGVFAFDVASENHRFARIFSTHLQHSEECNHPTDAERVARREEMRMIMEKVDQVRDKAIIVTGDLNLDDEEASAAFWHSRFTTGAAFNGEKTWGGDAFCAHLMGKRASSPLNFDYTLIVNGTARAVTTTLVETGFDGTRFTQEALSDHRGLYSTIAL